MHDVMTASRCTLVLVDYQQRLMPVIHRADAVLAHAERLADAALLLGIPVIGTAQNPAGLGPNVESIRQRCASTLTKMHFDACAEAFADARADARADSKADGLLAQLEPARNDVVIAGCEAHVCLMQTALGLLRAGRRVWVVASACGSRSAHDHALAMARLGAAGATMVSVEMVVFEWLGDCKQLRFKDALALVRAQIAD